MLECVVNISEGRRPDVLDRLAKSTYNALLDLHADPDHNRGVFTLAGGTAEVERAALGLATIAVKTLDMRDHVGVHPRIGIVDVVPFVPLADTTIDEAIAARDRFADHAAQHLHLPCFFYGPERTLPELRRTAFRTLAPDRGPSVPHPTAGACAVGARRVLVAYNLLLATLDLDVGRRIAAAVRRAEVRALAFVVGGHVQVSCNLVDPANVGPAALFDEVQKLARASGTELIAAELVGLLPEAVLAAISPSRWPELDLSADRTIEARYARVNDPNVNRVTETNSQSD